MALLHGRRRRGEHVEAVRPPLRSTRRSVLERRLRQGTGVQDRSGLEAILAASGRFDLELPWIGREGRPSDRLLCAGASACNGFEGQTRGIPRVAFNQLHRGTGKSSHDCRTSPDGKVPDGPAFRLVLIVLVAACGGQPAHAQTAAPGGQPITAHAAGGRPLPRDLKFRRLTTKDGLAQDNVVAILQDRRGFMWFATGEGLNRYDGDSFVVYKKRPQESREFKPQFHSHGVRR